jgi:hypothetical protein
MNDIDKSLVLITNKVDQVFGTGFVVYKEESYCYIVTCSHVVEDYSNSLLVDSIEAEIIYKGSSNGLDLAIIKAHIDKNPLLLIESDCMEFNISGFKKFRNNDHILEPISCTLDTKIEFRPQSGEIVNGWKFNIDESDIIVGGYSGSPLICKESGKVVAVVSNRHGGRDGYAICIKNLKTIWKDIPITMLWEKDSRLGITFVTDKGFKIFISYAYNSREEEEWILEVLQSIGNILEKGFNKDNFFLIDYQVNHNIENNILEADIFLVLLSKSYINNKQYLSELQTFKSNFSNTIILEYEKITKPSVIDNIKSFKFWSDEELHMSKTCTYQRRNVNKYGYFDLIEDIARKIRVVIKDKGKVKKKIIGEKIFLATTTDDLDIFRNDIRRYLEDLNYDVYPKQYYPHDNGNDFKEAVKKDLKDCKIFIQLLSQYTKKGTDSLPEGYNKAQYDLAQELQKPIIQWSEKIDLNCVNDKIQKDLLSTEFIKIIPIEEFKRTIEKELEKIRNKNKHKEKSIHNSLAFIDSCYREKKDRKIAKEIHYKLSKYLMVIGPPTIKKPSEISRDIDENLLLCDYYILVYGSVNVSWIKEQILIRYRKIALRRNKDISSIIVYNLVDTEKEDINISAPYIKVIKEKTSESIDEIKMYIDYLEEGDSDEIYA